MDRKSKMGYTLGIDLGTSGVKAGLLDLSTLMLEFVSMREYEDSPEQNPVVLWDQTIQAVKESIRLLGGRGQVSSIGLSGQMHGAVLYDSRDQLLSPLINWKDQKWSPGYIVEEIKRAMGALPYDELGTAISGGYSAAILFGIKQTAPELFLRIAHFVLPTDFLRGKLLGKNSYATDPTNAFGTGLFNTRLSCWHTELIRKLQLSMKIFPEIHPSSQAAGTLSDQVAGLVGMDGKIPVIFGGGDNQMSMLGSGLAGPASPILINIGTAAQISRVMARFERFPGTDTRSFFNNAYAVAGVSLGGGGSYHWLREQIKQADGLEITYPELDKLAERVPPGADGLIFCTGPTRQNPQRPRGFFGNTGRSSSIAHRARAVLEGVLMDLYPCYEILEKTDQSVFILGAGKGLQKSRIWSQITTDLFGKPLRISGLENAVFGAALMAAYGLGVIRDLELPARAIPFATELTPNLEHARFYRDEFVPSWRRVLSAE
jgi:xylulokinase